MVYQLLSVLSRYLQKKEYRFVYDSSNENKDITYIYKLNIIVDEYKIFS